VASERTGGIAGERVHVRNRRRAGGGRYVLYWMQQSQRARGNPALEWAVERANERGLPVVVGFGLWDDYPEAGARHYAFMLEGLREVARDLAARRVGFVVRRGAPDAVALSLAGDAALVVCDRGYLRHQRRWRARVAREAPCAVVEVEGDAVVPVETASTKAESAARTIRPRLGRLWDAFLRPLRPVAPACDGRRLGLRGDVDPRDPDAGLAALDVDRAVAPVRRLRGGATAARRRRRAFLRSGLEGYGAARREPARWQGSFMSPYLHFGQISPVEVALAVRAARRGAPEDRAAYLEELLVRRELAINFVWFRPDDYDRWTCLPAWAGRTLAAHGADRRPHVYGRAELEACATHDPWWNAAMREMVHTGFMQGYMRMYWGKKILEWSATPGDAFRTALALNNRWLLDGRDPSSYANVAWCFGLHDRPWAERPVFGTVRYMNAAGLERKFDMEAYRCAVERLVAAERG
jgi:deoxyribodipyrimidine photo-lyase